MKLLRFQSTARRGRARTEHIEGHRTRLVPLFHEVAELLQERLEQAEESDELVLPILTLRNTIIQAAKAAGIEQ